VRVNHGRFEAGVSEQYLNRPQVDAALCGGLGFFLLTSSAAEGSVCHFVTVLEGISSDDFFPDPGC
jgi:hypothetical protein